MVKGVSYEICASSEERCLLFAFAGLKSTEKTALFNS